MANSSMIKIRVALTIALIAIIIVISMLLMPLLGEMRPEENIEIKTTVDPTSYIYLSEIPWEWATTGWVALADDNLPKLDLSFVNEVISIGEKSYEKGLGVFPLSEIVYNLNGKYRLFQAEIGVDDSVARDKGSVIFKLFLDGALAYESGVLRSGMPPEKVEVPVSGITRMRLVVEDSGDGSALDYANWADAQLVQAGKEVEDNPLLPRLEAAREERKRAREQDRESLQRRSERALIELGKSFQGKLPGPQAAAVYDPERRSIVLANDKLAVMLGYGGERHGLLSVLDLAACRLIAFDTTPSLTATDLSTIALSRHTSAAVGAGYRIQRVEDPTLGRGTEVAADFLVAEADVIITPRLTLFDGTGYFTYCLELREAESDVAVSKFSFFDRQRGGGFLVGEDAGYITDYSMIRRAEIYDDSILRQELVGLGKPLLLYNKAQNRALLMAIIDRAADPAIFSLQLNAGRVSGRLGFEQIVLEDERNRKIQISPRLFFQATTCESPEQATQQFRRVMASLYPPIPMPEWVKYQWGTWYAFYMDYNEDIVRKQIDYIAENLADLGPWSILLDAGWYIAEGRDDSDWVVDEEKFPNGLRALVDYAHSKGLKVVLYFSAPYLDGREREGNWLGLRGFIEKYPDWLIPLQADSAGASYVYDLTKPEVVEHLRKVISDFFLVYDVDGIKIDGLGQAEGEQLLAVERDSFGDVNRIRMFTMRIYRFVYEEAIKAKEDAYIESGWATPNFANMFAHTFRYADEFPAFEHRYPAPGLLEHIDYASIQKRMLGQRPNMGMVWGGPESQSMIRLWFQAALAMGTQMTVSTDLTHLSTRDLSALRSTLVHYNAFQGETRYVGMPLAQSFATTTNGITYLGVVNRERDPKKIAIKLSDHGLDEEQQYLMFDVSSNRYTRVQGAFSASMRGSSFRLFMLRSEPGVMWTNSSFEVESSETSLTVKVSGPRSITGTMQIFAPSLNSIKLDGKELKPSTRLTAGGYMYAEDTGVLQLRYRHDHPHTIEVEY